MKIEAGKLFSIVDKHFAPCNNTFNEKADIKRAVGVNEFAHYYGNETVDASKALDWMYDRLADAQRRVFAYERMLRDIRSEVEASDRLIAKSDTKDNSPESLPRRAIETAEKVLDVAQQFANEWRGVKGQALSGRLSEVRADLEFVSLNIPAAERGE